MGGWSSAEGTKRLAAGLLAFALAAIAVVIVAGQKMVAIQGPGALGVSAAGNLWVGVDDRVWVLDAKGKRIADKPIGELGLKDPPSSILAMPDGNVLLASRGDDDWLVVDAKSMRAVRTIHPQWPTEFRDNVRALHLAVAGTGRIAAATGGGHTVLLFGGDGKLLARTKPGTFYFTNGLWHSPEGWWTTDTNRSRIHLLDDETLAVKRSVELDPSVPRGHTALGELLPSQGEPRAGESPIATVTRLGFLMEAGFVADVFPDGSQELFNAEPVVLRDIAWFNGQLIAVDGKSYQLLRFGPDRRLLDSFGDVPVRGELRDLRDQREFWSLLASRWGLLIALVVFLAGIGAYSRHKKLATLAVLENRAPSPGLSGPELSRVVRQRLWIYGLPMAVRFIAAMTGLLVVFPRAMKLLPPGSRTVASTLELFVACAFVPVLIAAAWQQWRHERLMRDPRYESVLNRKGHEWLDDHADWDAVAEPGETLRESIFVAGWVKRWLLVTNRRVLLFAASARERVLQHEWRRADVVYAGAPRNAPGEGNHSPLWRIFMPMPNLVIVFADGTRSALRCASSVSAERAARVLMGTRAAPGKLPAPRKRAAPGRRWREVLAAFVLPGSGQWMQGRFVTGTVMFTGAIVLFIGVWGPVLWASTGPKMHVFAIDKLWAVECWLLLSLAAAADAFHFSLRRRAHP